MEDEPSVAPPQPASSSPSSSNSRLGNSVIPIVNKLQDIFAQLGSQFTIKLPQVAVVGIQSSIEHFVRWILLWKDQVSSRVSLQTTRNQLYPYGSNSPIKHAKAVQKLLGERKKHLDSVSSRLQVKEKQLEQQGKEIGLIELFEHTPAASDINRHQCGMNKDERGLPLKRGELVGCQMSALLNGDEIVELLGVISQHKQGL